MAENKRRLDMPKTCQKTAKILAHTIVPELNHLLGKYFYNFSFKNSNLDRKRQFEKSDLNSKGKGLDGK